MAITFITTFEQIPVKPEKTSDVSDEKVDGIGTRLNGTM